MNEFHITLKSKINGLKKAVRSNANHKDPEINQHTLISMIDDVICQTVKSSIDNFQKYQLVNQLNELRKQSSINISKCQYDNYSFFNNSTRRLFESNKDKINIDDLQPQIKKFIKQLMIRIQCKNNLINKYQQIINNMRQRNKQIDRYIQEQTPQKNIAKISDANQQSPQQLIKHLKKQLQNIEKEKERLAKKNQQILCQNRNFKAELYKKNKQKNKSSKPNFDQYKVYTNNRPIDTIYQRKKIVIHDRVSQNYQIKSQIRSLLQKQRSFR